MRTQLVGLGLPLGQGRSGLLLHALFLEGRSDLHLALLLDPVLVRLYLLGEVVQHVFRLFLPALHLHHFCPHLFCLFRCLGRLGLLDENDFVHH
jgi:hypothetical protein